MPEQTTPQAYPLWIALADGCGGSTACLVIAWRHVAKTSLPILAHEDGTASEFDTTYADGACAYGLTEESARLAVAARITGDES
ncbi:hypothetical protein OIE69_08645 [Actinacidiphila glaucinigra]|uniref:hypothetical protein n=1 Tax=Actinacidiphila glaucinigra TaxID=235986 RepID=UPI002DD83263|nr:hypothetical protein [Actinacidiphila glaucinigra]WSD58974.1 hypothetical protein OIE69_08645 [Actinacidiphila glaucinigra]